MVLCQIFSLSPSLLFNPISCLHRKPYHLSKYIIFNRNVIKKVSSDLKKQLLSLHISNWANFSSCGGNVQLFIPQGVHDGTVFELLLPTFNFSTDDQNNGISFCETLRSEATMESKNIFLPLILVRV